MVLEDKLFERPCSVTSQGQQSGRVGQHERPTQQYKRKGHQLYAYQVSTSARHLKHILGG